MDNVETKKWMILFCAILFVVFLTSCSVTRVGIGTGGGEPQVRTTKPHGPPPHAPAHGQAHEPPHEPGALAAHADMSHGHPFARRVCAEHGAWHHGQSRGGRRALQKGTTTEISRHSMCSIVQVVCRPSTPCRNVTESGRDVQREGGGDAEPRSDSPQRAQRTQRTAQRQRKSHGPA